jgi:AcrB/AcrD/AcrF family
MAGLPHLESTRSLSRYGISQVTVIFKDGTDIYFARQLISERIQRSIADRHRDRDGADLDGPGRNLHVHGGGHT